MSAVEEGPGDRSQLGGVTERAIIDALPRAVIVTAPDGRILLWNRAAERVYGWSEPEVLGRNVNTVLVPGQERAQGEAILATLAQGCSWSGDFSVHRRNGEMLRVLVHDRPVLDEHGELIAIVGASEDVTEQRDLERRAANLAEHLALALDAGGLGTWRWNMRTGETIWDERLESLFGLAPGSFDGTFDAYRSLLHPDDRESVLAKVEEAVREKASYAVEHRVVWPDGSVHWMQGKGTVTVDASGDPTGTIGCVADVTEAVEHRLAREEAVAAALESAAKERVSAERLEFLGTINDALSNSSTRAEVMENVTRAAVPTLGEWCLIHVLSDSGAREPDVEIAHVDPEMVEYAKSLRLRFPYDPDARTGVPAILRTGQSEFHPNIDDDVIAHAGTSEEAAQVVRALGLRSAISVPLLKRGRAIGVLQFVNTEHARTYTDDDLSLARAVAGRIASTLDNRRLADAQRTIATTLQAALLPHELPHIPGLEVAVRYWAAGEGVEVGGDFYDVFEVDDRWAVVIGDVCGTGPGAAALTGLARHTIRAAEWNGADRKTVLRQLNTAVRRSGHDTFCTALSCGVARSSDGFRFEVASGGHPLPVLVRADGSHETLGVPGTLLGLLDETRSTTVSTGLHGGDTVVLYTDGITDVRPPFGLSAVQMEDILVRAALGAPTAEDVVRNVGRELHALLPLAERNDDVALLVLRVV